MVLKYPTDKVNKVESIFLAGTIDMGNSEDWQSKIIADLDSRDITIYNPRRKDWDSSWKQDKNDVNFAHQVTWELECLKKSDLVIMYLAGNSKSPISLLELGLHLTNNDNVVVYCPSAFYRKGNIDITSDMYGAPVFESYESLMEEVNKRLDITI